MYQTIISVAEFIQQRDPSWVVLDCRFSLDNPQRGEQAWRDGHLPGAHYLNLDYHLSGSKTGSNGRHPLPDRQRLAVDLGARGISADTQVITHDDSGNQFAARAWWLLRWLGHENVAVLDGGMPAWLAAGGALDTGDAPRHTCRFPMRAARMDTVSMTDVLDNLSARQYTIVDARSPERFAGQGETLDSVAGHIPGAINRFFRSNLQDDGCFRPADSLRADWLALLGKANADGQNIIHQCGSGVTACVNLLSMEIAGLHGSRLYPGSWSEWCSQPDMPVVSPAGQV